MTQPYIGEIRYFGFDFPPRGWASCAGQVLPIQQNQALFALIGTTYGGNGVTTFNLPDLRSRAPVGIGSNGGVGTYTWGETGGTEGVTLLITQIPLHTHHLVGTTMAGTQRSPFGRTIGADTSGAVDFLAPGGTPVALSPQSIQPTGNNLPHSNLQPYLALNASIALQGLFPSRN